MKNAILSRCLVIGVCLFSSQGNAAGWSLFSNFWGKGTQKIQSTTLFDVKPHIPPSNYLREWERIRALKIQDDQLLTFSHIGKYRRLALKDGALVEEIDLSERTTFTWFAENGKSIVIGDYNSLQIFELEHNKSIVLTDKSHGIGFSASDLVAYESSNGISIYNIATSSLISASDQVQRQRDRTVLASMVFLSGNRVIASRNHDDKNGKIQEYSYNEKNIDSWKPIKAPPYTRILGRIEVKGVEKILLTTKDSRLKILNTVTYAEENEVNFAGIQGEKEIASGDLYDSSYVPIASPNGKWVAIPSHNGEIILIATSTWKVQALLIPDNLGHSSFSQRDYLDTEFSGVTSLVFSDDETKIYAAYFDEKIRTWTLP